MNTVFSSLDEVTQYILSKRPYNRMVLASNVGREMRQSIHDELGKNDVLLNNKWFQYPFNVYLDVVDMVHSYNKDVPKFQIKEMVEYAANHDTLRVSDLATMIKFNPGLH